MNSVRKAALESTVIVGVLGGLFGPVAYEAWLLATHHFIAGIGLGVAFLWLLVFAMVYDH